ncbi:hypothetical protein EVAR_31262_1 [Eumeta japonica]|uniref:Uncharacterized protein n=1 Tax=Eumeta variegata TaxID=151549 RepID=A0A4C1W2L3_EUMVA|nr:hypothetical protein EVAR_31262_1 [Eumeta japonica]
MWAYVVRGIDEFGRGWDDGGGVRGVVSILVNSRKNLILPRFSIYPRAYVDNHRLAGCIRPAVRFDPARETF